MEKMIGESPRLWSMNSPRPSLGLSSPLLTSSTSSSSSSSSFHQCQHPSTSQTPSFWHDSQEMPDSWCQLLLGGLQEEDRYSFTAFTPKKMEEWQDDHQIVYSSMSSHMVDLNQDIFGKAYAFGHGDEQNHEGGVSWSRIPQSSSSAGSCISASSFSSGMLDFLCSKDEMVQRQQDLSSEASEMDQVGEKIKCNNTSTGSALKKAKVQVRKEKVGDRVTTLHQLVSPFGKTDTASVLLEAIGYIRFLQNQIKALSSPYLSTARNKWHPEGGEEPKDLRSSGLCLVPVTFILHFGGENSNGADYWAPTFGGVFR